MRNMSYLVWVQTDLGGTFERADSWTEFELDFVAPLFSFRP